MYKDYFEKAGISDAPLLVKAIAYELLKDTLNSNNAMPDEGVDVPEELVSETCLVAILDLAGYWCNDLYEIFVEHVKDLGIDTPLATEGFSWIWKYTGIS